MNGYGSNGTAVCDGVDGLRERAASRLQAAGLDWNYREIDPDVFGEEPLEPAYAAAAADRIAALLLAATRRAGRAGRERS